MVGQNVYQPDEIQFLLDHLVQGIDGDKISQEYCNKFGKTLTANQLRYVKNKYGKDPKYGTAMINTNMAKKRKRTVTDGGDASTKAKPAPFDQKIPTFEKKSTAKSEPATPVARHAVPTAINAQAGPPPPTAQTFGGFNVPTLQSNASTLPNPQHSSSYDEQEARTSRRFSPGRQNVTYRSPRHRYGNHQSPAGWGGYPNQYPSRHNVPMYPGVGVEGNYTMSSTVQGNYQPAQPRQMPPLPGMHQGHYANPRYHMPDFSYQPHAYNQHQDMAFMAGGMGSTHGAALSGHAYGPPVEPLLQQASVEGQSIHDAHNMYQHDTHYQSMDVPGYYDHMHQGHYQMRSMNETIQSNSASLTHQPPTHQSNTYQAQVQTPHTPAHFAPITASLPSQSIPPTSDTPLPTASAPVTTEEPVPPQASSSPVPKSDDEADSASERDSQSADGEHNAEDEK